jgi:hypothetical protein
MTMPTLFPDRRRVSESPGSVPALRHAVGLARQHDAVLILVYAWVPPDGDRHERRHPGPIRHTRRLAGVLAEPSWRAGCSGPAPAS